MGVTPLVPIVDTSQAPERHADPIEIPLDDLQEARRDPIVKSLLKSAVAAGERVTRENRKRW
jgi:hypothetical protein